MEGRREGVASPLLFILLLFGLIFPRSCCVAAAVEASPSQSPSPTPTPYASTRQCLYVTNTGNGRLQVIDVASARPLPFWTLEEYGEDSASTSSSPSPSTSPLTVSEELMRGANQTGLSVGKNPTGLWIEHPYLFISYKWASHINIFDISNNLQRVGRIESQALLWCWSAQIAFSHDILFVTCTDDLQIHRFRWEGPDRSILNFTLLDSVITSRPTYGIKFLNKTDKQSTLVVSTPSENTIYTLNATGNELQPFAQQPEPVLSFSGIETRHHTLYVIDNYNSRVLYFNLSNPDMSGVFLDYEKQAYSELDFQLSDFLDLEFGNRNGTMNGRRDALFITSQRNDRIELFDVQGNYLGPFMVGKDDGTTISEPQNLFFHVCPVLTYPQANATRNAGQSADGFNVDLLLGVLVPLVALLVLLLFAFPLAMFLVYSYQNRRRTFDPMDDEEMGCPEDVSERRKYIYREIEPTDLSLGEILGVGAFGKVYRGCWRGGPVAVKVFDSVKLSEANEDVIDEIRKEAEMMEKLGNHPHVISFVGAITRPSEHFAGLALVTDYCSRGSLFELLVKRRVKVSPVLLVRMARDAAAGIRHLHQERIIHRDIAARNVLVGDNFNVYIADFGLARVLKGDRNTTASTFGPVRWMAPEAMVRREYSEASDAFSFGVLLWEMVTRKIPWRGTDSSQVIIAVAQKNTRLKIPKGCDPVLRKIMKGVWKENPRQRMTMAQVLQTLTDYHAILAQYEEEADSDAGGDTDGSETESAGAGGVGFVFGSGSGSGDRRGHNHNGGGKAMKHNGEVVGTPRQRPGVVVRPRASGVSDSARWLRQRRRAAQAEAQAKARRAQARAESWEVYTCTQELSPVLDRRGAETTAPQVEPQSNKEKEEEEEDEEIDDDDQPRGLELEAGVEVYTSFALPLKKRRRRCLEENNSVEDEGEEERS